MTCSLVVNSKSGNTRMVSGAIKRALQAAGVEFVHAAALSDDADADQVALEAQGACAADTVLVRRLRRLLKRYGHAEYTTDAAQYRPTVRPAPPRAA